MIFPPRITEELLKLKMVCDRPSLLKVIPFLPENSNIAFEDKAPALCREVTMT